MLWAVRFFHRSRAGCHWPPRTPTRGPALHHSTPVPTTLDWWENGAVSACRIRLAQPQGAVRKLHRFLDDCYQLVAQFIQIDPVAYCCAKGCEKPASPLGGEIPWLEVGFSQPLALALLSIIMYKQNMDSDQYQRDEHCVHLIVSHLTGCPRRRKRIFVGKFKERCQQLIEEQWREKGWIMLEGAIQPDHLHVFGRAYPSDSAADVVKELKGVSSLYLRKAFREVTSRVNFPHSGPGAILPAVLAMGVRKPSSGKCAV